MNRQLKKQLPKIITGSVILFAGLVVMVVLVLNAMGQKSADKYGCFEGAYQKQTVVIVDASCVFWPIMITDSGLS